TSKWCSRHRGIGRRLGTERGHDSQGGDGKKGALEITFRYARSTFSVPRLLPCHWSRGHFSARLAPLILQGVKKEGARGAATGLHSENYYLPQEYLRAFVRPYLLNLLP